MLQRSFNRFLNVLRSEPSLFCHCKKCNWAFATQAPERLLPSNCDLASWASKSSKSLMTQRSLQLDGKKKKKRKCAQVLEQVCTRCDAMWWDVMRSCAPDTICRSVVCTKESQQKPICAAKAACATKEKATRKKQAKLLGRRKSQVPNEGSRPRILGGEARGSPIVTSSTPEIQGSPELGCRPRNQFPCFREKAL